MLETFAEYLTCPSCKKDQIYLDKKLKSNGHVVSGYIICKNCGKSYEIREGIPNMIEYPENIGLDKREWDSVQREFEKRALTEANFGGDREKALLKVWSGFIDFVDFEGKMLDIGCGPMLHYLSIRHFKDLDYERFDYFGVDPLANFRKYGKLKFSRGLGEAIPYKDDLFGSVIISHALDHCLDPPLVLKESFRCLKNQGKVYVISLIHDNQRVFPENFSLHKFITNLVRFSGKEAKKFIAYHLNRLSHSKRFTILDIIALISPYFRITELKVVNNQVYIKAMKDTF